MRSSADAVCDAFGSYSTASGSRNTHDIKRPSHPPRRHRRLHRRPGDPRALPGRRAARPQPAGCVVRVDARAADDDRDDRHAAAPATTATSPAPATTATSPAPATTATPPATAAPATANATATAPQNAERPDGNRPAPTPPGADRPAATRPPTSLDARLEAVDAKAARLRHLTAHFEQAKASPLLRAPLVSTGTLRATPAVMLWLTEAPSPTRMRIDGQSLALFYVDEKVLEIYPIDAKLAALAANPLPRLKPLREQFEISLATDEETDRSAKGADAAAFDAAGADGANIGAEDIDATGIGATKTNAAGAGLKQPVTTAATAPARAAPGDAAPGTTGAGGAVAGKPGTGETGAADPASGDIGAGDAGTSDPGTSDAASGDTRAAAAADAARSTPADLTPAGAPAAPPTATPATVPVTATATATATAPSTSPAARVRPTTLRLRLVPKTDALRRHVDHVIATLDESTGLLIAFVVTDPDGETTTLTFSRFDTQSPLDADALELKVPPGTKVVHPAAGMR